LWKLSVSPERALYSGIRTHPKAARFGIAGPAHLERMAVTAAKSRVAVTVLAVEFCIAST
jgi:hypothetical protein